MDFQGDNGVKFPSNLACVAAWCQSNIGHSFSKPWLKVYKLSIHQLEI